jgi:hypothetical protein
MNNQESAQAVNAVPLIKINPYIDFHLAESLAVSAVEPIINKKISLNDSWNEESIILLDKNGKLDFYISGGTNSYIETVKSLSKRIRENRSSAFVKDFESFKGKRAVLVVPEKQTLKSLCGHFCAVHRTVYEKALNDLIATNGDLVVQLGNKLNSDFASLNLSFQYDSHLTNLGSLYLFQAIAEKWKLQLDLNAIQWAPRIFKPDLVNKFVSIAINVPWITDNNLCREVTGDPRKNRGLLRIYRNSTPSVNSICVIFGDSHSYSGFAPIASQIFKEVRFYWGSASNLEPHFLLELISDADFILEELSERFYYSTIEVEI